MKKSQIAAIILVGIVLASFLVLSSDFSSYETFDTAIQNPSKSFSVVGYYDSTKKQEYNPIENPNRFVFYAKDKKGVVKKVILNDSKPQDFEKSEQLVMKGHMAGNDFFCKEILMKCPSKYQDGKGPKPNKDGFISSKEKL